MTSKEVIEAEINDYVQKYAIKHHISEEEARKHIMCKIVEKYYRSGKNV